MSDVLGKIDRAIFEAIVYHDIDPDEMREQVAAAINDAEDELSADDTLDEED